MLKYCMLKHRMLKHRMRKIACGKSHAEILHAENRKLEAYATLLLQKLPLDLVQDQIA